jgi:hypothetical protein
VNFVKQFPFGNGNFLFLYHGTTTFLRIGDISLIDKRTFRLAGLGDVKTGPVENGQVQVGLAVVGNKQAFEGMGVNPRQDRKHLLPVKDPERFNRQLERMAGAVAVSMPAETRHLRLDVNYSGFKGTLEESLSSGSAFRNLSASLAVVVAALPCNPSLYSRLTRASPEVTLDILSMIPDQLAQLAVESSEDNALWVSKLSLHYMPGATPNFWTGMPAELAEALLQDRIAVTTIYNPARFIQKLRTLGFRVKFIPGEAMISVAGTARGAEIKIENIGYFLDLIQCYLVDEMVVANSINDLVQNSCFEHSAEGAIIDWLPMQRQPGIADLDK